METQVHIVGDLKLQNQLMCEFLEKETGLSCMCCEDLGLGITDMRADQRSLILWDCLRADSDVLWDRLGTGNYNYFQSYVALFNVGVDMNFCKEAVNRGVRGVFFESDPPSIFPKGVQAILNGELWFTRDILAKYLLEIKDSDQLSQRPLPDLTAREKEILAMVASGGTNGQIARELCISRNTVKTHVYNICQKIKVTNRLQAALWAVKNL